MESSTPQTPPGWYPDPGGSPQQRYWDGERWTDALAAADAAPAAGADSRGLAVLAHLSALLSLFIGLPFVGPLIFYLVKKDDPLVRRHAVEALNFNLSWTIYGAIGGFVLAVLIFLVVGLLLIPFAIVAVVMWFVLVIIAANKASNGEDYRYPLTIRFLT